MEQEGLSVHGHGQAGWTAPCLRHERCVCLYGGRYRRTDRTSTYSVLTSLWIPDISLVQRLSSPPPAFMSLLRPFPGFPPPSLSFLSFLSPPCHSSRRPGIPLAYLAFISPTWHLHGIPLASPFPSIRISQPTPAEGYLMSVPLPAAARWDLKAGNRVAPRGRPPRRRRETRSRPPGPRSAPSLKSAGGAGPRQGAEGRPGTLEAPAPAAPPARKPESWPRCEDGGPAGDLDVRV
jgi:hypothetical protein